MKGKALFAALMLLFVAVFAMTSVSAQLVAIDEVEFDEDTLNPSGSSTSISNYERNQDIPVKVHFTALTDDSDVQVEVALTGFDDGEVRDSEYVDDVKEDETYVKRLSLSLPWDMDQAYYTLRVTVCPRSGDCVQETYELDVEAQDHGFVIKDVDFSPGLSVEAGRALLTTVRVENIGDDDESEGVKVKVSIPELGLSATDYLDSVDESDSASSEELYIRVPSETPAGDYNVEVAVTYDDGDETETEEYTLTVTAAEETSSDDSSEAAVESKTVITVGPDGQDMTAGQGGAVYPITLTNAAGEAKTYVISVSGYNSWGNVRIDPSNVVVLGEGETQTVYLFVSANEDASGSYTFAATVSAGSETLKQMLLTANVEPAQESAPAEASSWDSVKKGLEVGLIVLIVLLVILGLIIVVNKLRSSDDEEDEKSKTYY